MEKQQQNEDIFKCERMQWEAFHRVWALLVKVGCLKPGESGLGAQSCFTWIMKKAL